MNPDEIKRNKRKNVETDIVRPCVVSTCVIERPTSSIGDMRGTFPRAMNSGRLSAKQPESKALFGAGIGRVSKTLLTSNPVRARSLTFDSME